MKRFWGVLCSALFTLSAFTIHASALYFPISLDAPWGGLQEADDKGMLKSCAVGMCSTDDYSVFLREEGQDGVYVIAKRSYYFGFVVKPELDADEAVMEIVHRYYPEFEPEPLQVSPWGISRTETEWGTLYRFYDNATRENLPENMEAIKRELLDQGLISKFYNCGRIGTLLDPNIGYLSAYAAMQNQDGEQVPLDIEAIQQYIDTTGLDCTLQFYANGEKLPDGSVSYGGGFYCVVPNEELTYAEHFAIAADIYEALGLTWGWNMTNESKPLIYGQNALEYPGDLNIDGTADVSDAVLLARIIAEDDSMPAICDTGYLNADVDGDGLLTILDVTALLETLVN